MASIEVRCGSHRRSHARKNSVSRRAPTVRRKSAPRRHRKGTQRFLLGIWKCARVESKYQRRRTRRAKGEGFFFAVDILQNLTCLKKYWEFCRSVEVEVHVRNDSFKIFAQKFRTACYLTLFELVDEIDKLFLFQYAYKEQVLSLYSYGTKQCVEISI